MSTPKSQGPVYLDRSQGIAPYVYVQHHMNVFEYGRLCRYCFKVSETLKRCGNCRRVSYCSAECQQKDWKFVHKKHCKVWQTINKQYLAFGQSGNAERDNRLYFSGVTDLNMSKNFPQIANDWSWPLVHSGFRDQQKCSSCVKTPWESEKFPPMTRCEGCLAAWWCSPECLKEPKKSWHHWPELCDRFRDQSAAQYVQITRAVSEKTNEGFNFVTSTPRKTYLSLNKLKNGWADYTTISPELEKLVKDTARDYSHVHPAAENGVLFNVYEEAHIAFTILASLEDVYPDLATRTQLCIHIVGGGPREIGVHRLTEELLHFLPALKSLQIVYIGPRTNQAQLVFKGFREGENVACSKCRGLGRSRKLFLSEALYHDFSRRSKKMSYAKPDLAIMPNSGFTEEEKDSWQPTLKLLLDLGLPLVFTTFTEYECQNEEKALKAMGANVIHGPEKNKWCGVKTSGAIEPGFNAVLNTVIDAFSNHYRLVIRGKK